MLNASDAVADLLADPQVRRIGRRATSTRFIADIQSAPAEGLQRQGRPLRLRRRVPPHPVRQAARRDEGAAARRDVHRLHRHAAAQERQDRRSIEIFGPYIHTYKYDEAVRDGVVLDLRYEARDIDQSITSPAKVDQWFELKTKGLTDVAKAQLKKRWGTMQKVLSAPSRGWRRSSTTSCIDMETRDRLKSGRGNAMLVSGSIYQACRFYEMFQQDRLHGQVRDRHLLRAVASRHQGRGDAAKATTEKLRQYDIYRKMLADHFDEPEETAVTRSSSSRRRSRSASSSEPGQMRLLIVVDKLLTGFDAPPATYLYIDKKMRDHGLFQAICRVNRLDGEDKEYGYIIDYKDLFKSLERVDHRLHRRGLRRLRRRRTSRGCSRTGWSRAASDSRRRARSVKALCEPVEPPSDTHEYSALLLRRRTRRRRRSSRPTSRSASTLYKLVAPTCARLRQPRQRDGRRRLLARPRRRRSRPRSTTTRRSATR